MRAINPVIRERDWVCQRLSMEISGVVPPLPRAFFIHTRPQTGQAPSFPAPTTIGGIVLFPKYRSGYRVFSRTWLSPSRWGSITVPVIVF
jgi:hypothetical protein